MDVRTLASLSDGYADAVRSTLAPSSVEECEQMLRSLNTVTFEVAGLGARLRDAIERAGVNGNEPPHPVKPFQPKPPPPPPPPPPTKPGGK